jgi:hypothetical protein
MPFRGAGLVALASRRQFCAAAGVQKLPAGLRRYQTQISMMKRVTVARIPRIVM